MNKLTILSLVVAVAATLSLSAADAGAKKHAAKPVPADVLKKFDKNNDGKVNKKDGLTDEEMKAFRAEMKKAPEAPAPAK